MDQNNNIHHHILQKAFVDYFLMVQNQKGHGVMYGEAYQVECAAILEELVKKYAEVENARLKS